MTRRDEHAEAMMELAARCDAAMRAADDMTTAAMLAGVAAGLRMGAAIVRDDAGGHDDIGRRTVEPRRRPAMQTEDANNGNTDSQAIGY